MKWSKPIKDFFQIFAFNTLPYYFQANDTYKDSEGKGILERFIGVCSSYFDSEVVPDIDNFMECLDVDTADPLFINYLWEYFGDIPYAYGIITKGEPYTEENLNNWAKQDRGYPTAVDFRTVLKYAISLYKIRGTSKFYDLLGQIYNVSLVLTEVDEQTKENLAQDIVDGSVTYDTIYNFDSPKARYDSETDCWECVPMILTIGIPLGQWNWIVEQDKRIQEELLEEWNKINSGATDEEIEIAKQEIIKDHPSDFSDKVKRTLVDITNKYLPVNVKYFDVNDETSAIVFSPATAVIIVN